ncbi:hypothetical protein Pmani_035284 [Petrolisthes manimaculis]|uniref:Uncharacterized protein n=1 Tax=Petrolisthes manimaculis TaxID=1843537 RepID=A0AAE1TNC7_9EUCA|nr:hypothetical protein Pmani_035284 [Petrolisthes manimaculis]
MSNTTENTIMGKDKVKKGWVCNRDMSIGKGQWCVDLSDRHIPNTDPSHLRNFQLGSPLLSSGAAGEGPAAVVTLKNVPGQSRVQPKETQEPTDRLY